MRRFKRRDWGFWLVLWRRPRFKVKLLRFKKGGSISMQRHNWRNELWLFLKGAGTMEPEPYRCSKGDWKMINSGDWHKYTAFTTTWVLEIQFGELCVEKDIERKDG